MESDTGAATRFLASQVSRGPGEMLLEVEQHVAAGGAARGSAAPFRTRLRRVLALPKHEALRVVREQLLRPRWKRPLLVVAVALALLVLNDVFLYESVLIPSASMAPTILPNERVFLRKFPGRAIKRFDVVVIRSRIARERIVKRVVGLPGERIRLEDSWKVYVNDRCLSYSPETAAHQYIEAAHHQIQVSTGAQSAPPTQFGKTDLLLGPDEYFVLGDNRLASRDSRVIGPIKRREIQGTIALLWYSYDLQEHRIRTERLMRLIH